MHDRRLTPRDLGPAPPPPDGPSLVLPYAPAPLPPPPLCIPLPAAWHDDPGYALRPYAFAGCAAPPAQFGVIGTLLRANEQLAMGYEAPFAHAYFGPPGSGKSYLEGVHLESALLRCRYQTRLPQPLCGVAISYGRHQGGGHGPELLSARLPNQNPDEVRALVHEHGTLPQGFPDLVVLTPPRSVPRLRAAHPHCQVLALSFSLRELGAAGALALMGLPELEDDGGGSLLAAELGDLLAALPPGAGREELRAAVEVYPFRDRRLRALARRRVALCCEHLDDRAALRGLLRPGRLLVVDLRDGWLPRPRALALLSVLLDVLALGDGPPPCGLLLCIDEAHKLLPSRPLRRRIEHLIRERRHLRVSVILSTQDPQEVPHSTLAELDGVGLFGTGSERSIRHLARDLEPFSDLRPADAAALGPGQLLLWTRRVCSPYRPGELEGRLLRVQVRPRLSHHGGATQSALD